MKKILSIKLAALLISLSAFGGTQIGLNFSYNRGNPWMGAGYGQGYGYGYGMGGCYMGCSPMAMGMYSGACRVSQMGGLPVMPVMPMMPVMPNYGAFANNCGRFDSCGFGSGYGYGHRGGTQISAGFSYHN